MEVNISHRIRQEILSTNDISRTDLFKNALGELMQLMKLVCLLPSKPLLACSQWYFALLSCPLSIRYSLSYSHHLFYYCSIVLDIQRI